MKVRTAVTALILSLAFALPGVTSAQSRAPELGYLFALELDGTLGCPIQAGVTEYGGACWTLDSSDRLHQTLMNHLLGSFSDVTITSPWIALDAGDGAARMFTVDGHGVEYIVYILSSGAYTSYGIVAPALDEGL